MPSSFDETDTSPYGAGDTRFVGTYRGTDFYLLRNTMKVVCLGVSDGDGGSIACGGPGGPVGWTNEELEAELLVAPVVPKSGWTTLGDNVRVRG